MVALAPKIARHCSFARSRLPLGVGSNTIVACRCRASFPSSLSCEPVPRRCSHRSAGSRSSPAVPPELPSYPVLFTKWASSMTAAGDPVELPPESEEVDYEGELAVIIGRAGRRIKIEDALGHVAGVSVANDITMRDYQRRSHQWLQGKAWDACIPLGPELVTLDEVSDPKFTMVEPGDVILTGTPGGVGATRPAGTSITWRPPARRDLRDRVLATRSRLRADRRWLACRPVTSPIGSLDSRTSTVRRLLARARSCSSGQKSASEPAGVRGDRTRANQVRAPERRSARSAVLRSPSPRVPRRWRSRGLQGSK